MKNVVPFSLFGYYAMLYCNTRRPPMNQKTVKLLKKYAHLKGMNVKELK